MSRMEAAEFGGEASEPRQRLTRALAAESRNALARVSLAASEIARFEGPPRLQEMVAKIDEAVRDIDGLLDNIDGLAASPPGGAADRLPSGGTAGDFGTGLAEALARIEPVFIARGISTQVQPFPEGPRLSAIPAPVLMRLFLSFIRLGLARTERGGVVQLSGEFRDALVSLRWRSAPGLASALPFADGPADGPAAASLLEVEAGWAQWGGWIETEAEENALRLCLPLHGRVGEREDEFGGFLTKQPTSSGSGADHV